VDAVSTACAAVVVAALGGSIAIALSFGLFADWLSSSLTGGFLLALLSAGVLFRQTIIEPCRTIERKARAAARQEAAKAVDSRTPQFSDDAGARARPGSNS
jgi:hypothetical protein